MSQRRPANSIKSRGRSPGLAASTPARIREAAPVPPIAGYFGRTSSVRFHGGRGSFRRPGSTSSDPPWSQAVDLANAGVETFRNDVGQTGLDGELHVEVGIAGQQA